MKGQQVSSIHGSLYRGIWVGFSLYEGGLSWISRKCLFLDMYFNGRCPRNLCDVLYNHHIYPLSFDTLALQHLLDEEWFTPRPWCLWFCFGLQLYHSSNLGHARSQIIWNLIVFSWIKQRTTEIMGLYFSLPLDLWHNELRIYLQSNIHYSHLNY